MVTRKATSRDDRWLFSMHKLDFNVLIDFRQRYISMLPIL